MADPAHQKTAFTDQAHLFLQSSPDCAIVFDRRWSVVYANPAFRERFCGTKEAEGTSFLSYLDPPSEQQVRELQPQLFQGNRQIELKLVTMDGKVISLHFSFFPLPTSGSDQVLMAGVGRDRTADMALLNEVIQLNIELEQKQKELSEANARLEQLAITDQITQLYNRHYFFQVAQHFWEEARRYKLSMVAIMMDIDNFKAVNDTYGHLFGDYVLQDASSRLKGNTRKSDILARYGGEELILIAPNTDMLTGLVLAERLRFAMASAPFVMGSCSASVTISLGVSGTELGDFSTFESLLESSDNALYSAKHAGKNCVCAFADLKTSNP
jgi:diguanylate cyclase (GGDEF)-like protein/PAS domain S-box-containing protein